MQSKLNILVCACLLIFLSNACKQNSGITADENANSLPFILDMVHNNPGEKPTVSKYNDPEFVKLPCQIIQLLKFLFWD
jgi:hypothetical protein